MASKRSKTKRKKPAAAPAAAQPADLKNPVPHAKKGKIREAGGSPEKSQAQTTAASAGRSGNLAPAAAWAGFVAVLLACIAWVGFHAFLVDAVTVRLCENADKGIPAEKRMPVFLSEIAFDGYTWNRHAEHIGKNGEWRVRHTDFDNAPAGREVHWNSAFVWYLRALGEAYRAITGDSLRNSIFRMSIWANPILLVLALGIFSTLSARRFGPLCGTVIALGMVSVPTFYEGFMPAYPDHHGLIAFALLGMLFGIAWAGAGWIQSAEGRDFVPPHSLAQARHGMIFSALCGAAGLWISALSTAMVLAAIGTAALVASLAYARTPRRQGNTLAFHPDLWKTWAAWGAGGSLAFYVLEYFPWNMGMRMEVNHPLYALAWLGGGWIIAILAQWCSQIGTKQNPFPWTRLIWPALACAVLPAVILLGGDAVYSAKDPFMVRLYKNIAELLPLFTRIKLGGLTWQIAFGWFPVFLLMALGLQWVPSVGRGTKAVLGFLAIPILFITALQIYQVRWGMLAGPLYIALAGIAVPQLWKLLPRKPVDRAIGSVLLLAFAYLVIQPSFKNSFQVPLAQFRSGENVSITPGQGLALLHRQMARAILDSAGGQPVVLLSSPNSSCLLSALGGFRTIGTLYWENVEGLKSAAAGLNAQDDQAALEFLKAHGVTHISLMTWENFIGPYFGILYPEPVPGLSYEKSFAKRALFDKVIPPWTRPIPFPPNDLSKGLQQTVLMLQVTPEQTIAEAKIHLARYVRLVEGNPITAEITLREVIDSAPESIPARIELADLYLSQGRYREAADQTIAALKFLPPESRLSAASQLAEKFTAAGQPDLAAEIARAAEASGPAI